MVNYFFLINKDREKRMLKVRFEYDLPEFDPDKHDPDETFAFLTYRGVYYAKRVQLKSRSKSKNWKITR